MPDEEHNYSENQVSGLEITSKKVDLSNFVFIYFFKNTNISLKLYSFKLINLSLLYIQNAKNFEYAFYGCSKIKNLDLSSFNNNANEFVINKYN